MRVLAFTFVLSLTACASQAQDLSTIDSFLEAFQSAAATGDADALGALVHDDGQFPHSYADSVMVGGEWHDRVMATTAQDLNWGDEEYADYWITLWEYVEEHEGEEYESNISCEVTLVEGAYRINQCVAAG